MDIKQLYDGIIRKVYFMIGLAVVGGGIAGALCIFMSVPVYQANSSLYVMNRDKIIQTGQMDAGDLTLSHQLAQDYCEIVHSRSVISEVAQRLKMDGITEEVLNSAVTVSNQKDSSILTVSATWSDPQIAARLCNTTSSVLADKINELTRSNNVGILDQAEVPHYPMSNNLVMRILIGVLIGLMLGFGIIYTLTLFDTAVHAVEDIENGLGLKVMGIIPEHSIR
ncbi:MAG: Wzz/FepE/Etk N-terminal domain-containing protein [Syntrophomonas sp.]